MTEPLKLMCILAHPDDETFGAGGILAKYAAEGVETSLLVATLGQRGWTGDPEDYPGLQEMGDIRAEELRCSADVLGVKELILLDFVDGELHKIEPQGIVPQIAGHLRRVRPQVVVTFDPFGLYGHPDHIAISQFAMAAVVAAASPGLGGEDHLPPHTVSKLYFVAESEQRIRTFETVTGEIAMSIDDEERKAVRWPSWSISAEIDATAYWDRVIEAFRCHKSQVNDPDAIASLRERFEPAGWGINTYYRAFSLVNTGRAKEKDLFEGLRPQGVHVAVGT